MGDGANISPEQAAPQESLTGKTTEEVKQGNIPAREADALERQKYKDDRFWSWVQHQGTPTELTKDKVATVQSRAVAQAAKEGLLSNQQAAIDFWNELGKFPPGIFNLAERQKKSLELLNRLRIAQGKPPISSTPISNQQPDIKPVNETPNRSRVNPLNWFSKKGT